MASPIIYDAATGGKTSRAILASDVAFASGAVQSGALGAGVVFSGTVVSGQIGQMHLSSGAVNSGHIGDAAVVSGSIASGSIAGFHLSSGAVNSGHIANGAVVSGSIASGQIGGMHLSSGAVQSGHIGNAAVVSGSIASGQIGGMHLSSGAVQSGHIGNAAVLSGSLGSGQIGTIHLASGISVTTASQTDESDFVAGETISGGSGGMAILFNPSGKLILADPTAPSASGRMPAIGIALTNALADGALTFRMQGQLQDANFNYSGQVSKPVFVGSGGFLRVTPPSASGNVQQRVATVANASGVFVNVDLETIQV